MTETRNTDKIVYREDLYPRIKADPTKIQEYAENLDVLPPIEVNQNNELIDGFHRWTAHKKAERTEIAVIVTPTQNEAEFLELAITRNATHGMQLSAEDKRRMAVSLYGRNGNGSKEHLASLLSVSSRTIATWVRAIDDAQREERNRVIREMWLACHTQEEIAEAVKLDGTDKNLRDIGKLENFQNYQKLSAAYQDVDWSPQLYDIWNFSKNDNETKHYGNTHVGIVDNLLYTFTEPFETVIDPFGGGGSTIDVCKKRLRRYWVSDRKPPVERPDIRQHDLINYQTLNCAVSGPYHWNDVALVYLDPPYWKQAAGKYSNDLTDLANMTLYDFTAALVSIINEYGKKLRPGAHVACIISPTQWPNQDKSTNYHDIDIIKKVGDHLQLERHIICPYSTEQYNGTQVNIAKREKINMVVSRRLAIWRKVG